jgi:preprotein translocase subunit SecE
MTGVAFDPLKFARDVRSEVTKVTWPSRKETTVTTGLVFVLGTLAAAFFFIADQIIGVGVRLLFGTGF